jgi:hypothetical protein
MLNGFGQREGIPAQQIDVVEYERRETRKTLRFYWESLGSKLLQSCIDVGPDPTSVSPGAIRTRAVLNGRRKSKPNFIGSRTICL